jgi:ABC-type phosphate transport system substrate-binding protein
MAPFCLLLAGVMAPFVAPSVASASLGEQCSGSSIMGIGSELQENQQGLWSSAFNSASNKSPSACSGTQGAKLKPSVGYLTVGGQAGLEAWGVDGHAVNFGLEDAFIGTDEPPNATQREEIVSHSSAPSSGSIVTIPVQRYAVAIVFHLPLNCRPTSSVVLGYFVLDSKMLEEVWRGKIHDWDELLGGEGGNRFVKPEDGCKGDTPITRVVGGEDSGSSWTLKRYLYLINKEKNIIGTLGWRELAEGSNNTEWPGTVTRPSEGGEEAIAKLVTETPGSIGFVDWTTVQVSFTKPGGGGEYRARFVAPIQNNGVRTAPPVVYVTPSRQSTICQTTEYADPEKGGLPPTAFSLWNGVTTKTTQPGPAYPLCGLSYDIALTRYSQFPGTTQAEATTVSNFLRFSLSKSAGGEGTGLTLPLTVLEEARRGAERIQY